MFFCYSFCGLEPPFDVLFAKNRCEFEKLNASFPFPQVFSLLPFPLEREPTATAWRGTTLSTRINKCRALIMPPRFVRRLRNNTAQSLVLVVKLGFGAIAAVAARVPSSKSHISLISTLRISFRFGCGCPTLSVMLSLPKHPAARRIFAFFRYARSFDYAQDDTENLIFPIFQSGVGVPPQSNHQADNLAKLRQEFLSVTN